MHSLVNAIKLLDEWLETMKQIRGYAGPVAHWWQSCYQFVGPGLDWRYEGILAGYSTLWAKTHEDQWIKRVMGAADHLAHGQLAEGSFRNSGFEANPGTLGTPHEAAASLGLLVAMQKTGLVLDDRVAIRNLEYLISQLWDGQSKGFNDKPQISGRVPNKLATLAEALIHGAELTRYLGWLSLADRALGDIVRLQVETGVYRGAVHQWGSGPELRGDGRFFPYYNARCIPGLVLGAEVLENPGYREHAELIGDFLDRTRNADGSWPQILYENGKRVEYPHWIAPTADILRAYILLGRPLPLGALDQLLSGQLPGGGFVTARGFARRFRSSVPLEPPDYRDITPVVGWNDKVLRLLSVLIPDGTKIPRTNLATVYRLRVMVGGRQGTFRETDDSMSIILDDGATLFDWNKQEPWSRAEGEVMVR